ncbi:hypothetical protein OUZ56_011504 [Daphnia magna]|uniref:Uncharacterized protein n=1 Tax=Daphnia magna TaxID=35525 RepID=A0ABQ9Z0I0_9CRUS|nr:hypothetical protein OUZ56_011504 [Daphnia magna]
MADIETIDTRNRDVNCLYKTVQLPMVPDGCSGYHVKCYSSYTSVSKQEISAAQPSHEHVDLNGIGGYSDETHPSSQSGTDVADRTLRSGTKASTSSVNTRTVYLQESSRQNRNSRRVRESVTTERPHGAEPDVASRNNLHPTIPKICPNLPRKKKDNFCHGLSDYQARSLSLDIIPWHTFPGTHWQPTIRHAAKHSTILPPPTFGARSTQQYLYECFHLRT